MGNWLEHLEEKKRAETKKARQRSDKWSRQWEKKHQESKATYDSNRDKIVLIFGNVRSIALRVQAATGSAHPIPLDVSGYTLRLGRFPGTWKSDRGSSGTTPGDVRRIEIKPCRKDSFRVSTWDEHAFFTEQTSYIRIDHVSEDIIVSWLRWVEIGKGFTMPMDKIKWAVLFAIGSMILWLIAK